MKKAYEFMGKIKRGNFKAQTLNKRKINIRR
jgi:hypothetical protein